MKGFILLLPLFLDASCVLNKTLYLPGAVTLAELAGDWVYVKEVAQLSVAVVVVIRFGYLAILLA